MKIRIFILLFMAFVSLGGLEKKTEQPLYRWPLDINNGFSSGFQEFRSNHFHAGMDFRTFQKTGYPVRAVAGGAIVKIRMVKRGSGRGLYLKHHDGNTSIYFHLDRFAPAIEQVLKRVQKARGRKYIDNYYLKKPIPVKEGQIIAYSGETGYGFPHLHLEIRDAGYFALNPFPLMKFPARDKNFPRLKSLLFRSLEGAPVNGMMGEQIFRFLKKGPGSYQLERPVYFTGPFDLVLSAVDVSDTGRPVCPYRVSAAIDGDEFFHISFDRFERDDNNQLGFVYDMEYTRASALFFNLFFQEGFELEDRKVFNADMMRGLAPGRHELRVEVVDHFGNLSTGIVPLEKLETPRIEIAGIERRNGDIHLDFTTWSPGSADQAIVGLLDAQGKRRYKGELNLAADLVRKGLILKGISNGVVYLDFDFSFQGTPILKRRYLLDRRLLGSVNDIDWTSMFYRDEVTVRVKNGPLTVDNVSLNLSQGGESSEIMPSCSAGGVFFTFKPLNRENDLRLNFVLKDEDKRVAEIQERLRVIFLQPGIKQVFREKEFEAEFATRSVYEPRVLKVEEKFHASDYPLLSRQVSLEPYNFPFLDTVFYKFYKQTDNPAQVGIFKYRPNSDSWHYVSTTYDRTDRSYRTRLISSGTFALMRDMFEPEIYLLRLKTRYLRSLKRLVIKITDKGKGVNDNTLKVWLNGQRVYCEYDPDWRTAVLENLPNLRFGKNILKVTVKDWAQNLSTRTFSFNLK